MEASDNFDVNEPLEKTKKARKPRVTKPKQPKEDPVDNQAEDPIDIEICKEQKKQQRSEKQIEAFKKCVEIRVRKQIEKEELKKRHEESMRKDIREEEEDLEVKEPVKKPRLKRASKPKKIQEIHYEEPQEVMPKFNFV